jgi:hypothetical protein
VAALPGQVTTAAILFIVMSAVAWPVLRRRSIGAAAWPFLLWVTAMGTMLLPIAHDYNLLFIPLAVLSAWSARDPWPVQLCAAAVLPWWQPFFTGATGLPWLLLKVVSVAGIGMLVVRRVREVPEPETSARQTLPATGRQAPLAAG